MKKYIIIILCLIGTIIFVCAIKGDDKPSTPQNISENNTYYNDYCIDESKMLITCTIDDCSNEKENNIEIITTAAPSEAAAAFIEQQKTRQEAFSKIYTELCSQEDFEQPDIKKIIQSNCIADLENIDEITFMKIYTLYASGIVEGESCGEYTGRRYFRPDDIITDEEYSLYTARINDKSIRKRIIVDGQLIRTENLPHNYTLFDYILDDYPNEYYEWNMQYQYIDYYYPDRAAIVSGGQTEYGLNEQWCPPILISQMQKYSDIEKEIADYCRISKEYILHILNVDYRTLDEKWLNEAKKYVYSGYGKNIDNTLAEYAEKCISNEIIIECSDCDITPSSLYFCADPINGEWLLRVHVTFRIVSCRYDYSNSTLDNELILASYIKGTAISCGFQNTEINTWRDGWYDICINAYDGEYGIGTFHMSDWYYNNEMRTHI